MPQGRDFAAKTELSRLISFLLYGFLLCFCRLVIGTWALREFNALGLANQSARYIGYKQKPHNKVVEGNIIIVLESNYDGENKCCFKNDKTMSGLNYF